MRDSEWITRCADRLVSRGGMPRQQAESVATEIFETCADGTDEFNRLAVDPESAADEEMSYWGD